MITNKTLFTSILCCSSFSLVINFGFSITSIVVAYNYSDNHCDNNNLISLSNWFYVLSSIYLYYIFIYLCFRCMFILYICKISSYILYFVHQLCIFAFLIIWTVIGFIVLSDSYNCDKLNNSIWSFYLIIVILNFSMIVINLFLDLIIFYQYKQEEEEYS